MFQSPNTKPKSSYSEVISLGLQLVMGYVGINNSSYLLFEMVKKYFSINTIFFLFVSH